MSEPAPGGANNGLALLALFGDRTTDRVRKALGAYFAVATAVKLGRQWYKRAQTEMVFTCSLNGEDAIYGDVHRWLIDSIPQRQRRAMVVKSSRHHADLDLVQPVSEGAAPAQLQMYYDGSRAQTVDIGGHRVKVEVSRPDWLRGVAPKNTDEANWLMQREQIVFTSRSTEANEAVLAFLDEMAKAHDHSAPRFYFADRWGSWNRRSDVPSRSMETVVLKRGQREALVEDLQAFLAAEQDYGRLGIPWHRGYLLTGPPGTGKTSLAKALAGLLNLDVYYVALPAIEGDANLARLFAGIEKRAMLLIEDVDIVQASHDRKEEARDPATQVTLGGLLNGLDGMITPHGLVVVMTTNDASVLDDALRRPGRVDRTEKCGYLDDEQLGDLLDVFVGEPNTFTPPGIGLDGLDDVTSAEVIGVLKDNLGESRFNMRLAVSAFLATRRR